MLTFVNDYSYSSDFMCLIAFIERKMQNFIPKFREILPWREAVPSSHRMKFYKRVFFFFVVFFSIKIMQFLKKKWYMLWLKGIFLYFQGDLKNFLIAGSPFNSGYDLEYVGWFQIFCSTSYIICIFRQKCDLSRIVFVSGFSDTTAIFTNVSFIKGVKTGNTGIHWINALPMTHSHLQTHPYSNLPALPQSFQNTHQHELSNTISWNNLL